MNAPSAPAGGGRAGQRRTGMPRARARYLVQALELEESAGAQLLSQGVLLTTLLVLGAICWAALTQVNEVARASGELVPLGKVQSVQHLEGGIVADLHVRNGDRVRAGEVLLRIADAGAHGELEQLARRHTALDLRLRRLDALLEDRMPDFGEAASGASGAMVALQREVFETQRTASIEQLRLIRAERGRIEEDLAAREARVQALTREVSLMREELARVRQLAERDLLPATDVNTVELALLRTEGDLFQVQGEWGNLQRQLRASRQRERELLSSRREAWNLEREEVASTLAEVEARMAVLRDRTDRLAVRAPLDGIVQGLAVTGVGAVLAPGQTVLQIVPGDGGLLAEARVSPDDVGHLKPGQTVDVKVSSFEPQRYGTLSGELTRVSASTYLNEERQPYYLAEIRLAQDYLGTQARRFELVPGMLVQADIIIGRKSVLDYLLKPVYRGFSGALRER